MPRINNLSLFHKTAIENANAYQKLSNDLFLEVSDRIEQNTNCTSIYTARKKNAVFFAFTFRKLQDKSIIVLHFIVKSIPLLST